MCAHRCPRLSQGPCLPAPSWPVALGRGSPPSAFWAPLLGTPGQHQALGLGQEKGAPRAAAVRGQTL